MRRLQLVQWNRIISLFAIILPFRQLAEEFFYEVFCGEDAEGFWGGRGEMACYEDYSLVGGLHFVEGVGDYCVCRQGGDGVYEFPQVGELAAGGEGAVDIDEAYDICAAFLIHGKTRMWGLLQFFEQGRAVGVYADDMDPAEGYHYGTNA